MNKRQLEAVRKKSERIKRRDEKLLEIAKENIRKKEAKIRKAAERNAEDRRKQREKHQKLIAANREAKALGRLFGDIPPLKRKPKKQPSDFKGYYYDHQRQKFRVQFRFAGKQYRLGLYDTPEIAHNVYLIERAKQGGGLRKGISRIQRRDCGACRKN